MSSSTNNSIGHNSSNNIQAGGDVNLNHNSVVSDLKREYNKLCTFYYKTFKSKIDMFVYLNLSKIILFIVLITFTVMYMSFNNVSFNLSLFSGILIYLLLYNYPKFQRIKDKIIYRSSLDFFILIPYFILNWK